MDLTTKINALKARVAELKIKDAKLENFGAGDNPWYNMTGHHYEFGPVMSEEEVSALEKKIGTIFPEEYREYLKLAGNGGVGPAWGLWDTSYACPNDAVLEQCPDFCSEEFPYTDSYAEGAYAVLANDFYHRGPYDDAFCGYIQLANYGHDMKAILIICGEQRGKMWLLDEPTSLTPFVQTRDGKTVGVGFLDWYNNWLDEHLVPGAQKSQF